MSEAESETRISKFEVALALLLGLAATLIAWSSYQSALLQGDSIKAMNISLNLKDESGQYYNEAIQQYTNEQALFLDYIKAAQDGNTEYTTYLEEAVMSEDLVAAIAWWDEQPDGEDAPRSPFVEENPAWNDDLELKADRLWDLSAKRFKEGEKFDDRGDRFDLLTVLLASALFFFGLASILHARMLRYTMTIAGTVLLAYSLVRVLEYGYYAGNYKG